MEDPTNPKNSKFLEDLQKASEEIEAGFQKEKAPPIVTPETKKESPEGKPSVSYGAGPKETPPPAERGFDQDLRIQAEEVAKEKKRLEEIQKNLEENQKQVAECIQELTTIQGEISKVLEGKKKIDEDLRRMKEKNQKIFEELKNPESFWFPKSES